MKSREYKVHLLVCPVWSPSPSCRHAIDNPTPLQNLHRRDHRLEVSRCIRCAFMSPHSHSAIRNMQQNLLSSDQWIRRHVLKFQPRLAKHHRKRILLCLSINRGRLITLLEASPAALKRFRSVFRDRRRWGSHWSLRRVLKEKGCRRTNPTRARSCRCDVTRGLPDLGRSLTSLLWRCFLINLLTTVWWQPRWARSL